MSILGERIVFTGGRDASGLPSAGAEWATLAVGSGLTGCFATAPSVTAMADARTYHSATRVPQTGELLIVGGFAQAGSESLPVSTTSGETFSPTRAP